MNKKSIMPLASCLLLLSACGGGTTEEDEETETPSGTIAISGTLGTGTVTSLGAAKSVAAAEGYTVVVVDNSSNKTYQTTTGADGTFSVDVPAGSSYVVSLINDGSYIGPTVFSGSSTEVNTAITPSENTDLGSITVDETQGYAQTATAPDSVDTEVVAVATDGKPFGAGYAGKVQNPDITEADLLTNSDQDKDGVPNIFDADEDNDGIRNGIAGTPSGASVVSDHIEAVFMSSNIWKEHGSATSGSTQAERAANEMALRLHVVPLADHESMISSVQCIDVPASIASVATVRWAESLGAPDGYPDQYSLWSDAGYGLYRTTDTTQFPQEQWIVSIKPVGVMNVGDTFTIRVTYTDSSYEDFYVIMPYVLTDWAKILTYDGNELTEDEGKKTVDDTAPATDGALTIVFSKPVDEDGNVLDGATYSIVYGASDCTSGICSVPNNPEGPSVTDDGSETLSYDVPTPDVGTTYYITPVAEMGGQRNGEETWFTRE